MAKFTVTRTLPNGVVKSVDADNLRRAGQIVAYCLNDNYGISRKEATKMAMEFEKTGQLTGPHCTWTLIRNA